MEIYMVRGLGEAPVEAPERAPGALQRVREMEIYMVRGLGKAPGDAPEKDLFKAPDHTDFHLLDTG